MARPYQAESRGIVIGMQQIQRLQKSIAKLADTVEGRELAERIGEQQEDSARRRILETSASPRGKKWKPWSEQYAKTRGGHHRLLYGEGHLAGSITHNVVNHLEVEVGSNLVYAAAHLYGTDDIPARPYLDTDGTFGDPRDREEIRDIVRNMFELKLL